MRRPWLLRACALLLAAYGFSWVGVGLLGYVAFSAHAGPIAVGYGFAMMVFAALMAPTLLTLSVFVWQASAVAVFVTLLPTLWVAVPPAAVLGIEVLDLVLHPSLFDWRMSIGAVGLLALGPGVVIGLLFAPSSVRAWSSRV